MGSIRPNAVAREGNRGLAPGGVAQDGLVAAACCCWVGVPGLRPSGFGPIARRQGGGALVHSRPWFTSRLVDRWLGFGGLGPLPLLSLFGSRCAKCSQGPAALLPLFSPFSTATREHAALRRRSGGRFPRPVPPSCLSHARTLRSRVKRRR
jgi:hypothetical protein